VAFLLTGCNVSPVEVKDINKVEVKSINNNKIFLDVTATVYNPNRTVKVKDSKLSLYLKGSEIGNLTQEESIIFKGNSTKTYKTSVTLEITNLSGGLLAASKLLGPSKKDLKLNGTIKVTGTLFCKTIKIKDYQVFR
jgi:LEA14-like dessication related protein